MTTENSGEEEEGIAFAVVDDGDRVRLGVYGAVSKKYRFSFALTEEGARTLAEKLTRAAWKVQENQA